MPSAEDKGEQQSMVDDPEKEIGRDIHNRELEREVSVCEVMNKTVLTMDINSDIPSIAREMINNNAGSVIVTENGKAMGIITERDFVRGIVSQNKKPSEVNPRKILSTPLITVKPETSIVDASRIMLKADIKRLPVLENGMITGVISNTDILMISPGLTTILKNLIDINRDPLFTVSTNEEIEEGFITGMCETCNLYSVDLELVEGMYMCENCRHERGENYE
ncbi:MAG TPA: CBS domain-containing protein [Methanosarcina sp.]|nr:CBS domain-containing protein [Methanosarcina sp.]